MAHMKRYMIPKFWPVPKKERKWVIRPGSGPHPLNFCIPLQILVKNILGYAGSSKEAKKIIKAGKILVDKKARLDPKFPVGLMDIIEIPETNEFFRVLLDKNEQKVLKHFRLDKGIEALIIAGANMGISGKIKEIKDRKSMLKKSTVTLEIEKGKSIETLKDYVLVGGGK